jgi:drug/metabolite transporter (DMT)-like permease
MSTANPAKRRHAPHTLSQQPVTANLPAAMFWMAVALASFTLVAITGRIAGRGVDTMHLMFYRSIIALIIVCTLIAFSPTGFRQIATARFELHAIRNSIHFIAQFSWLSALMIMPLAQLFAIEFTAPLWVAVLAPLLLSERLTVTRIIAAVIGFAGILVILRPGSVALSAGSVFALIAAIGFAGAMISTKQLVRRDSIFCVLFHMSWMQLLVSGIALIGNFTVPNKEAFIGIFGVACAGMMAHYALSRAFTHADAIIVAPMDFLRLPLIMVVGVVLYGEPVEPMILVGGSIVIVANLINVLGERRHRGRGL